MRSSIRCGHHVLLASALLAGAASTVRAEASLVDGLGGTAGFGSNCLGPNDDGASEPIDVTAAFPAGLRFFGTTYDRVFVNTNGNVSFGAQLPQFTPNAFPVADQPIIAPYWTDVDIRSVGGACVGSPGGEGTAPACHDPTDNGVWWHLEPGRMIVTWDAVGYFDCKVDKRMSFQLVLSTPASCAETGDFDVELRYARCEWTTGDMSGGVDGLGGIEAQAGFDAGNERDWVEIEGSRMPNIHRRLCEQSNVGESGVWRFRVRSGSVVCAGAGDACDTGFDGVCALGRTRCVGTGTECEPQVTAGDERCNALDDDCDGAVDEGSLCADGSLCDRGSCVRPCTEFGCPIGFVCRDDGVCGQAVCEGVTCDAGQRCELGVCIGACDGVRCPEGRTCRGGRCVDPCRAIDCGECGVCEAGLCIETCAITGCSMGQACADDGRCVEAGCAGVSCDAADHCVAGSCVDRCAGARCPRGEVCMEGACRLPAMEEPADGGPSPRDGGTVGDGGGRPPDGGSPPDGGDPPGADGEGTGPGCACRVTTGAGEGASPFWLLGLAFLLRRRAARRT